MASKPSLRAYKHPQAAFQSKRSAMNQEVWIKKPQKLLVQSGSYSLSKNE